MDSSQELELLNWHLLILDSQFLLQLSPGRPLNTKYGIRQLRASLPRYSEWMGAASISPHPRKGNLFVCSLLQQKTTLLIEKEDAEGSVEKALVDVGHQMAELLAAGTDGLVVAVEDNADFLHETDLFWVVAFEVGALGDGFGGGDDFGEEGDHFGLGDVEHVEGGSLGGGGGGGHDGYFFVTVV